MVACCLNIETSDISIVCLSNLKSTYSVSCFPLYLLLYPLVFGSSIANCSQNTLPTPSSCLSRTSFHPLPLAWNALPEISICWNPLYPPKWNSNVSPSVDIPFIRLNSTRTLNSHRIPASFYGFLTTWIIVIFTSLSYFKAYSSFKLFIGFQVSALPV